MKELKTYEKNKKYDLKNLDFFQAMQEDFPVIKNNFVNTDLIPKFKYMRFIIMDLNIGSLGAKRDSLLTYIDKLKEKNIYVIAISIQEVWSYNKTLEIPGYVFYHNTRPSTQGEGLGFLFVITLKAKN